MRLLLLLLFLPFFLGAQITDNFDDGNITDNPTWNGETEKWAVADGQLRSNGPALAETASLYTSYELSNAQAVEWNFFVNPKVGTSSNNFMDVILFTAGTDLQNESAIFIRIGDTDDEISMYQRDGAEETLVIDGVDDTVASSSNNPVRIKVVKENGIYTLSHDVGLTGLFVEEGTYNDQSFLEGTGNFGVFASYSASNSEKYFFDDLYIGDPIIDLEAPTVVSNTVTGSNTLTLVFSEPLDPISLAPSNFVIAGFSEPMVEFDPENSEQVVLTFADNTFSENETTIILVSGVSDFSGNVVATTNVDFVYVVGQVFDVLITEFYPDPTPPVGLPEIEFVELYNATSQNIDLTNWTISDAGSSSTFDSGTIAPESYVIVCKSDTIEAFESFGTVVGISSLPGLNNGGDDLELRNATGKVMAQLSYTSSWYQNPLKDDGGWTLEMIDVSNPCAGIDNWRASEDLSGGTPGRVNSIAADNPDTIAPEAVRVLYNGPTSISVEFSENFAPGQSPTGSDFEWLGNTGTLIASPSTSSFNVVDILLPVEIQDGVVNELRVKGNISDCSGNTIGMDVLLPFGAPALAENLDVVINEILFNPVSNSVDFVELFNRSQKIIDLRDLRIARGDPLLGFGLISSEVISTDSYLLFPAEYVAITESKDLVLEQYDSLNPNGVVDIADLPTYDDKEDVVVLAASNGVFIDRVSYTDDWHHPLVDDQNGVSIERIDYNGPSQNQNNWQSAAENVGYATPAFRNSNFFQGSMSLDLGVEPKVFSPDSDGFQDFSILTYNLERDGFAATVKIYNDRGLPIKMVANNELLSLSGTLKWDGSTDDGEKAVVGKYIWLVEMFHPSGDTIREKFVVNLVGNLK